MSNMDIVGEAVGKRLYMNVLSELVHTNALNKGFWSMCDNIPEKIMLVVTELGEAVEALRKNKRCKINPDMAFSEEEFETFVKDTFEDEIADAIIRLLDLCGYLKIPIHQHIEGKMTYNLGREYLHGKSF